MPGVNAFYKLLHFAQSRLQRTFLPTKTYTNEMNRQIKEAAESDIHKLTFQLLDTVSGIDEEHIYRRYELTNESINLGSSESFSGIPEDASQRFILKEPHNL